MIGYCVNYWLVFRYLHPLLNRLGVLRRLRWEFVGPDGGRVRYVLGVDWGHTAAEVWEWHREATQMVVGQRPGWRAKAVPREVVRLLRGV